MVIQQLIVANPRKLFDFKTNAKPFHNCCYNQEKCKTIVLLHFLTQKDRMVAIGSPETR